MRRRPDSERDPLGALLLENGLITASQLENALAAQETLGGRIGSHLVRLGALEPRQLVDVLSRQLGLPVLIRIPPPTPEALRCIPLELAEACMAVPIAIEQDDLRIAMVDPSDDQARERLTAAARRRLAISLAPELTIQFALTRAYGRAPSRQQPSGFQTQTLDVPAHLARDPVFLDSE